ncbi:MAG: hypothetical protein ACPL4C_01680, partial [Brevinematia bacterium]
MGLDFFQVSKIFISLMLSLFMFLEFQRNRNREFLFLGIIFGIFLLKELVYIGINLYSVNYTIIKDPTTGAATKVLT